MRLNKKKNCDQTQFFFILPYLERKKIIETKSKKIVTKLKKKRVTKLTKNYEQTQKTKQQM